jgi:mannosyl-oligosaccharide alpha-1,2-mannosidase
MGLTLIDSLDTLLVMQLDDEAELALQWIEQSLSFGEQEEINLFEVTIRVLGGLLQACKCAHYGAISSPQVTIRVLGGLLSAYEATGRSSLLDKAEQLGQRMLFAFHTPYVRWPLMIALIASLIRRSTRPKSDCL